MEFERLAAEVTSETAGPCKRAEALLEDARDELNRWRGAVYASE